jgi:hypothetical protein
MYFRYQLAENIDSQMRRLADDLKEIIERMNAASRQHEATADPVNSKHDIFSSCVYVFTCFLFTSHFSTDCQNSANSQRSHRLTPMGGIKLHSSPAQT